MACYIFKSTDAGAPTLSGTAGSLVNLFDKLFVDGYNSQTITITRSGSTATASCTSHGFVNRHRLLIAGADQAEYNGEFRITYVDANTFTFTVSGTPATPATGTITAKVAPLGWTTAFTATNKRAYRMPSGTNQFYLRVVDDGTGSAAYGRVVGYESMSDIDTGSGDFPTAAQLSGGAYCHKSTTADATARAWRAYSDGRFVHIIGKLDGTYWYRMFRFGDCVPLNPADVYCTIIDATWSTSASGNAQGLGANTGSFTSATVSGAQGYAARGFSGIGSAVAVGSNDIFMGSYVNYTNTIPYPSTVFGGLVMGKRFLFESGIGPRAIIPGWWGSAHGIQAIAADLDTWSGSIGSEIEGREFEVTDLVYSTCEVFEISDTWDA